MVGGDQNMWYVCMAIKMFKDYNLIQYIIFIIYHLSFITGA